MDASSATQSTLLGGALGPISEGVPGLETKGRLPDLFHPRALNEFGKNSQRLLGQEAIDNTIGEVISQLIDFVSGGSE